MKILETGLVFWWQQVSIFKVVRSPCASSLNQTILEAFLLLRLALQILLHTEHLNLISTAIPRKKRFVFLENARLAEMQIHSCSSPFVYFSWWWHTNVMPISMQLYGGTLPKTSSPAFIHCGVWALLPVLFQIKILMKFNCTRQDYIYAFRQLHTVLLFSHPQNVQSWFVDLLLIFLKQLYNHVQQLNPFHFTKCSLSN